MGSDRPGEQQRGLPPFTNEEVLRAFALVMPEEMVRAARLQSTASADEPCTFWISDSILLVLAAQSEEFARRVAEFRPDLRGRIEEVRRDPEGYIESMKMPPHDDGEDWE